MSAFEDDDDDDDDDSEELYAKPRKEKVEKKARLLTLTLKTYPCCVSNSAFKSSGDAFAMMCVLFRYSFLSCFFVTFCVVVLFFEFEGSKELRTYKYKSVSLTSTQIWLCKCFFLTRQSVFLTLISLYG